MSLSLRTQLFSALVAMLLEWASPWVYGIRRVSTTDSVGALSVRSTDLWKMSVGRGWTNLFQRITYSGVSPEWQWIADSRYQLGLVEGTRLTEPCQLVEIMYSPVLNSSSGNNLFLMSVCVISIIICCLSLPRERALSNSCLRAAYQFSLYIRRRSLLLHPLN